MCNFVDIQKLDFLCFYLKDIFQWTYLDQILLEELSFSTLEHALVVYLDINVVESVKICL
jgi:hypothetical protein